MRLASPKRSFGLLHRPGFGPYQSGMTHADSPLPASLSIDADGRAFHLDPRDPTFFADPYPAYAALHAQAPLAFWHEAGCLAVASHPLVERILKSRDFGRVLSQDGSGRPVRGEIPEHLAHFYEVENHSLLDLEAPAHTRLRALLTRAFVSRRIEALAPEITSIVEDLIDRFDPSSPVEIVSAFAEPLPVAVIAGLIGVPREDAGHLLRWSHAMVAMYQMGRTPEIEHRANAAAREFRDYLLRVIGEKRRKPTDDLLSGLIEAETDSGKLTEEELVSLVVLLLNAGHEATVHQIGNALAALARQHVPLAPLGEDDTLLERTVEEALRFDTPLHLFRRFALRDVEIGDRGLKRGEEVALLLAAANHDPAVFPEPGRFDAGRARIPHVSFGAGVHFCIGAPLARLELKIAFRGLARRYPTLAPVSPPRFRDSYHFRGVERLDVTL